MFSAFETRDLNPVISVLEKVVENLTKGTIQWASVGQFFPYVIFLSPVLNTYLHGMSESIYECLTELRDVQISPYYQPFQWIPHATIGKTLSKNEMQVAFEVLQEYFSMFEGQVLEIGLARTNPHRDIDRWKLS